MRKSEKAMLTFDLKKALDEQNAKDIANVISSLLGIDCYADLAGRTLSIRGLQPTKLKARHVCMKVHNLLHDFIEIHSHGVEIEENKFNWYVNI